MKIIYHKYHDWPLNNINAIIKVVEDKGEIRVFVNDKDKTHVKEEIFKTINWHP